MPTFHITSNGSAALCRKDWRKTPGHWLIHDTYADRELDDGHWCLDCQKEIRRRAQALGFKSLKAALDHRDWINSFA